ncbi:MAG: hypothetical protein K2X47_10995, partial [Bdellovibrionales bacterium]|nr:hypothetical protein [Bdellovibrionales bacterium]
SAAEIFDAAMASDPQPRIDALTTTFYFSQFKVLMDVGGGHGHLLAGILRKISALRGILFDLAHVIEVASRRSHCFDLGDRIQFESGDFLKSIEGRADGILLSQILHDWGDLDCVEILKICRQSLILGGKIVVHERILPERPSPESTNLFFMDMQMLTCTSFGRERSQHQYERIAKLAGLHVSKVIAGSLGNSVIVMEP